MADWAYQSVAVHLCGLGLAQESDVLVVDCGCGSCLEGCLECVPAGPGLALHLSRSEVVGERRCPWVCLVTNLLSRRGLRAFF